MPMYEYRCATCERDFSLKMTMDQRSSEKITCPQCRGREVLPQYSSFYPKTSRKS